MLIKKNLQNNSLLKSKTEHIISLYNNGEYKEAKIRAKLTGQTPESNTTVEQIEDLCCIVCGHVCDSHDSYQVHLLTHCPRIPQFVQFLRSSNAGAAAFLETQFHRGGGYCEDSQNLRRWKEKRRSKMVC